MRPPFLATGLSASLCTSLICATFILLAAWLKLVVAQMSLGLPRFFAAVPIFVACVICPLVFEAKENLLLRLCCVFIFSWLCNFKVLAFCWGRAPLQESMTVAQLAAIMMLPIFPKPPKRDKEGPEGRLQDSAGSAASLVRRWVAKIVFLGAIVYVIVQYGDRMPKVPKHYGYAFGLYAFVGFLMDGPAAVVVEALGIQLVPTFDQPWMSSSLADFWGRRWNITTSSVLRTVVYDPIVDGSLVNPRRQDTSKAVPTAANGVSKKGPLANGHHRREHQRHSSSQWRRLLGLHATFFVSGLVHEYIAWTLSEDGSWGWKWLVFFSMQAPMMAAEAFVGRRMRAADFHLPRPLCILLTLAAMEAMAYDLFFGFVETDTTLAQRVLMHVSASYVGVLSQVQPLLTGLMEMASA